MLNTRDRAVAAAVVLASCASVAYSDVEVIYSRANGPTSIVPGAVDLDGNPVVANFNSLAEFWLSPDGTRWILRGLTNQPTTSDSYLILGSGTTGSVYLQEGRPFPGAVGAEVLDFPSTSIGYPFNENNEWAISLRSRGGLSSTFNKIIRVNSAGVGELRFQMGDLYSGMADINASGDETIGNSTASVHLLNDGRIGWHDLNPGNLHSSRYPVTAYNAVRHYQSNAEMVTNITNTGLIGLSSISSTSTISTFLTSPDGSRVVVRGKADVDFSGTSTGDPDCVVVNDRIVAQINQPLPGDSSIVVTALHQTSVAANNDWYMRGAMSGGVWAVRNGDVLAKTGDAVGDDAWGASFFSIGGNRNGDWYLIGKTTNPDAGRDDVVVVNGTVVLREGDPVQVDLDNDGVLDTAYIGRGNNTLAAFGSNNCAGLAPDGTLYVIAMLRTAEGTDGLSPAAARPAALRTSTATATWAPTRTSRPSSRASRATAAPHASPGERTSMVTEILARTQILRHSSACLPVETADR
jgi:hypothetical protein